MSKILFKHFYNMKKLILFFTCMLPCLSWAQKVVFDYDDRGNRISRTLVVLSQSKSSSEIFNDSIPKEKISESILSPYITIYPNPTKGDITFSIKNCDDESSSFITLYSESGAILQKLTSKGNSDLLINLSSYSDGFYIIDFKQGNIYKSYKIIKKQ